MLYQALHTIVNKPSLQTSLFCPICCPKPFIKASLARGLMHPADRAAKSLTGIAKRITSYMVDPDMERPGCSHISSLTRGVFVDDSFPPPVAVQHRLRLRLPVRGWCSGLWCRPYEVPPSPASLNSTSLQRRFHCIKEYHGLTKFLTVSLET